MNIAHRCKSYAITFALLVLSQIAPISGLKPVPDAQALVVIPITSFEEADPYGGWTITAWTFGTAFPGSGNTPVVSSYTYGTETINPFEGQHFMVMREDLVERVSVRRDFYPPPLEPGSHNYFVAAVGTRFDRGTSEVDEFSVMMEAFLSDGLGGFTQENAVPFHTNSTGSDTDWRYVVYQIPDDTYIFSVYFTLTNGGNQFTGASIAFVDNVFLTTDPPAVTAVPVPATLPLLASALLGGFGFKRRRT